MTASAMSFGPPKGGRWTPKPAYEQLVHPALVGAGLLPSGEVRDVEGSTQDMRMGMDYIISQPDGTQTTVGYRSQRDLDWGTLTLRLLTGKGFRSELTRTYRSVINDGTFPDYFVQSYTRMSDGFILNAYVVRMRELYLHVVRPIPDDEEHFRVHECAGRQRRAPDGAIFVPVAISEFGKAQIGSRSSLIACGVPVRSLKPIDEGRSLWNPAPEES